MHTKTIMALVGGLGLGVAGVTGADAGFTLIDNFDGYDNSVNVHVGGNAGDVTNNTWLGNWYGTANAQIVDNADPSDNSLQVWQGGGWRGADTDLRNNFAQDFSLADGATGTYFFQVMNVGNDNTDTMLGLSSDVDRIDSNNSWQDFAVMPYIAGGPGEASLRVFGSNIGDMTLASLTDGEWYNVWLVVDNGAKTFDVYGSTGLDDGALLVSGVGFGRVTDALDLTAFGAMGGGNGQVRIDNLHFAQGVDASNPLVPAPGAMALLAASGLVASRRRR